MMQNLLAIDQGTTGSTAVVVNTNGETLARETCEFAQHFPKPAWVEHDPEELVGSVEQCVRLALSSAGIAGEEVAAIGITNQRETTLVWERASGRPIYRAIVWQDRRTASRCEQLRQRGLELEVQSLSGLVIDPYFSATKIGWILDEVAGARARAEKGELCFGTVDSFLIHRLTGAAATGAPHRTEVTNASRTGLMNLRELRWDRRLCELFGVPPEGLPQIFPTTGLFGRTRGFSVLPDGIPITAAAGDQQAALFGQGCLQAGDTKCTYGTGAFIVTNTGATPIASRHRLLSSVAWQIGDEVCYALEGSCFIAGAAVQWLRDGLGIIASSSDVEALARSVPSSEGVVFVPALSGLGAPHWDSGARGSLMGLTRGSARGHIARATLEAIALQVNDLLDAMRDDFAAGAAADGGAPAPSPTLAAGADPGQGDGRLAVRRLYADGGAAKNDLLMQLQADLSRVVVQRPVDLESTARGAALLAGVGAGLFATPREALGLVERQDAMQPEMSRETRQVLLDRWSWALSRTLSAAGAA